MVEKKNWLFIEISVERTHNKKDSKYPEDPPDEGKVQSATMKVKLTSIPIN
jgi:hypothetical protein